LCDDAFVLAENDPLVAPSRLTHDRIADLLGQCDIALSTMVTDRFPDGPPWDADFFDWVAAEFEKLVGAPRRST
jgi:hypothetical protein